MFIIRVHTYDGTRFSSCIYQNALFETRKDAQRVIDETKSDYPRFFDPEYHYYERMDIIELYPHGFGPRVVVEI